MHIPLDPFEENRGQVPFPCVRQNNHDGFSRELLIICQSKSGSRGCAGRYSHESAFFPCQPSGDGDRFDAVYLLDPVDE